MAQYFNQSWIDKVKDSCDIVDVISKYVPLKQKGRTFWGNCPFHHENEPSFAVSSDKQFFNCFGCHVGGNVITFITKYESLSFIEAVKFLAKQNNIELPETIDDEKLLKEAELKKKILEINIKCAKFYNKMLMSENGSVARKYLYDRGLTDNIITRFGLGYSPNWTNLVDYLKEENISLEDGYKAGVLGKKNDKYYDFFAERICFPIINSMGNVLGFSARVITKEYQGGKYKNSPESVAFLKSNIVYAINILKRASQKRLLEYAIICEGQMDVIALNQCGYDNVVACMGTALTSFHAKEIKKFVKKVIVCFDGDSAGIKATIRSLDILDKSGLEVFIITLPNGMDPDEYTKKYGKEKFDEILRNAVPMNDYKFNCIRNRYNLSNNNEKTEFIKEILTFIETLKTNSEKEIYLKQVSDLTKISLKTLQKDMDNVEQIEVLQQKEPENNTAYEDALKFVFSSYLYKKDYVDELNFKIMDNTFYSLLQNYLKENNEFDESSIFSILSNKFDADKIAKLENYDFTVITDLKKYYNDCVKLIKREELESEYKMLSEYIATIEDSTKRRDNLIKMDKIFNEIQRIKMEE